MDIRRSSWIAWRTSASGVSPVCFAAARSQLACSGVSSTSTVTSRRSSSLMRRRYPAVTVRNHGAIGTALPDSRCVCSWAEYSLRAKLPRPTVSMPLAWGEFGAPVERGSADDLLVGPDGALDRVSGQGDLFAPVLTLVERLPDLGP